MPFQFLCPQGHLLQGDEAHMGMPTQCPQCGILFIIPNIATTAYAAQPSPAQAPVEYQAAQQEDPTSPHDFLSSISAAAPGPSTDPSLDSSLGAVELQANPAIVHIPCPNGHELETPLEMLGQDVLCPHCGAQFHLRREDSREAQEELERREQRRAEAWFRWSIAAAVIVGLGLLAMIIIANQH
jgi:hypothetical protein